MLESRLDDLYSDIRDRATSELEAQAKVKFDAYVEEINTYREQITESENPAKDWFVAATKIIKEIIFETFQAYGVQDDKIEYQFYICGSLAKEQATPYSDLDSFIIWEDPKGDPEKIAEIEKIKRALLGMDNLFQRIFQSTNQFGPDPFGITPSKYHGTPEELYNKVADGEVGDISTFITSASTSRALTVNANRLDLLQELTSKFENDPELEKSAPEKLLKSIVVDHSGPRSVDSIDLKRDIFRPLDFFMMALRAEYNIYVEDGSHLITVATINELIKQGHLSHEFGDLLLSVYAEAIQLRFKNHIQAHAEQDEINLDLLAAEDLISNNNLLHKMAIIRGVAAQRLTSIEEGKSLSTEKIELTSISDIPYLSTFPPQEMTLDVIPYVMSHPGRIYFEQQRSTIRQNLTKAKLGQEGGIEEIFQGIKDAPQHLGYLSSTLIDCIDNLRTDGSVDPTQVPKLNREKFQDWCTILVQNALADLFDNKGQLLPWIRKLIVAGRPGELLLDERNLSNQQEINNLKQALLTAYILNLSGELINRNVLFCEPQNAKATSKIWREINSEIKNTLNNTQSVEINELARRQDEHYKKALVDFNSVVAGSIQLLEQIKINTKDEKINAAIDKRINKYKTLEKDIELVSERTSIESATTKSSFLHKAYHHFSNDFHQFEQEFKTNNRSLWVKFKETIGFIKHNLIAVVTRSRLNALRYSEKIKKLANFSEDTKHKFQEFSAEAATKSSPISDEDSTSNRLKR